MQQSIWQIRGGKLLIVSFVFLLIASCISWVITYHHIESINAYKKLLTEYHATVREYTEASSENMRLKLQIIESKVSTLEDRQN